MSKPPAIFRRRARPHVFSSLDRAFCEWGRATEIFSPQERNMRSPKWAGARRRAFVTRWLRKCQAAAGRVTDQKQTSLPVNWHPARPQWLRCGI